MSQAVATFFYGVPLVINDDLDRSDAVDQLIEDRPAGVKTWYSGNGTHSQVAAFGIELDQLDEGDHHQEVGDLCFTPSTLQIGEYRKLYAALSLDHKAAVDACGQPRTVLMWSST